MAIPPRLVPLLAQFDFGREQLVRRLVGLTDEEHLWEPVPNCWSIRPQAGGPGPGATLLVGAGGWGRDSARPTHPSPPPFTTIAWRLGHLSEQMTVRAEYTIGGPRPDPGRLPLQRRRRRGNRLLRHRLGRVRAAIVSADDAGLDMVGRSTYPDGGDSEERFIDVVWWVNQELLHHGAEIALLRDLYRDRRP